MSEHNGSGFFSRALKDLFGDSAEDVAPSAGPVGSAVDDVTLRKQWRKRKIDAMSQGTDFPSFSEFKAQQASGQ